MTTSPVPPPQQPSWLTRRFARVTTSGQLIPEVDGLRFFAISGVLLFHGLLEIAVRNGMVYASASFQGINGLLYAFLSRGHFGVQLFFVISGYVLCLPFAESHHLGRPRPTLGKFLLRRLTRLEPPYVLNLLVCYVIVAAAFTLGLREKGAGFAALFPHLGASVFYSHYFVFRNISLVNGVTWSLEVEAQFYLLMPLLAFLLYRGVSGRFRSALLFAVILAHGVFLDTVGTERWYLTYSLAGYINYFLAGILVADLQVTHPVDPARRSAAWDVAALGAVAVFAVPDSQLRFQAHYPVLFGLFCLAGLRGRFLRVFLQLEPVWLIGGMCYTIYLYHLTIMTIGARALQPWYSHALPYWGNFLIQFPILAVLIIVPSALLYLAIERPCMNKEWPRTLWRFVLRRGRGA